VNLASRIEGLTKTAGVELLVSQATRDQAGSSYPWRAIAPLHVKGVAAAVPTFTPLPAASASPGDSSAA
jgi:adenylate cyclase